MRVMILGKYNDKKSVEKAEALAKIYRSIGDDVINAVTIADMLTGEAAPPQYLDFLLVWAMISDALVFLPGWDAEKTNKLLQDYGAYADKKIVYV